MARGLLGHDPNNKGIVQSKTYSMAAPVCKRDQITSYGIICTRGSPDNPEFLMIQRKDSICYVDFVRGKYNIFDFVYMTRLLMGMTVDERMRLMTSPFEALWTQLWMSSKRYNQEYHVCREKFGMLKRGFYVSKCEGGPPSTVSLASMMHASMPGVQEPEWDFPKGRRSANEAHSVCALREFQEETGIAAEHVCLNGKSVMFKKLGCNDVLYKTLLFVGCVDHVLSKPPPLSDAQAREVKDVRWMCSQEVSKKLHNAQQRKMFESLRVSQ